MSLTAIILGTTAILYGRHLYRLKQAEKKVVVDVTAQRGKIAASGVGVNIKFNIKNPTNAEVKMTPPLIVLYIEKKQIATSRMDLLQIPETSRDAAGNLLIKPNAETGIIQTYLNIPWVNLLGLTSSIYTRLNSTRPEDKINIEFVTLSNVILPVTGSIPYESKTTIKL